MVTTQAAFQALLQKAYPMSEAIDANGGWYAQYVDAQGAGIWMQFDLDNKLLGANPHFHGPSRRRVMLTEIVASRNYALDGAFHAWADPKDENDPESGAYPFVFDVPNFHSLPDRQFPVVKDIQLAAFAHTLELFADIADYDRYNAGEELRFASKCFIPVGLFASTEEAADEGPASTCMFVGHIQRTARFTNDLTGDDYFWMLVDTLGGEVDVVADLRFFQSPPQVGGIVKGEFWLSGYCCD
jgi:hypothetical protein